MYGWGKKKEAKTNDELVSDVKKHTKRSGIAGKATAALTGASTAATVGMLAVTNSGTMANILGNKSASVFLDDIIGQVQTSNLLSSDIGRQVADLVDSSGAIFKAQQLLSNIAGSEAPQIIQSVGPYALVAMGAGIVGSASIYAYHKIRTAVAKNKIVNNVIDEHEREKTIKHADESTVIDKLDRLTDEQKFAVIYYIDQLLRKKRIDRGIIKNGLSGVL